MSHAFYTARQGKTFVLALLIWALVPGVLWAQPQPESVAVLGLTSDGADPPYSAIAEIEAILLPELGDEGLLKDRKALTRITYGLSSGNLESERVAALVGELSFASEEFFNQAPNALDLADAAIENATMNPQWLASHELLAAQVFSTSLIRVRIYLDELLLYEKAEAALTETLEMFPLREVSLSESPPNLINLATQARTRLEGLGYEIQVNRIGESAASINIHGTEASIPGKSRAFTVGGRTYSIIVSADDGTGALSLGPFSVDVDRAVTQIPIGYELLESMQPLQNGGNPPLLPASYQNQKAQATLLLTMLEVPEIYLVSQVGTDIMLAHATHDSFVLAIAPANTPNLSDKLIRAARERQPTIQVGVDVDGSGFGKLEPIEEAPLWPPIATASAGFGIAVVGSILLVVANGGVDDLAKCGREECTRVEFEEKASDITTLEAAGWGLLGGGGLVLVGGVVWLALQLASESAETEEVSWGDLGVGVTSEGASVTFQWRF